MSKRVFIAGVAVFVAAAAASGAAFASESGKGRLDQETHFVAVEEISVPIVGSDRIEGSLRLKLVLDAEDAAAAASLSDRLPEVRSDLIAGAIEFSRLRASAYRAINAERLRTHLSALISKRQPGANAVLILELAARPA